MRYASTTYNKNETVATDCTTWVAVNKEGLSAKFAAVVYFKQSETEK